MIRYLLSKNRTQQASMFLIVILATLATLIPIHLFRIVIDRAIPARDYNLLAILGCALVLIIAFGVLLEYAKAVMARRIQEFFISDLRLTLMTHIMDLPAEYFAANPVGKLVSRIMHDVSRFGMGIEWLLVNPAIAIATICIYSVYLVSIDPTLTLVAALPLPIVFLASAKISAALSQHRSKVMDSASNYTASVNEIILAATEIQSNGTYRHEQKRLADEHKLLSDAGIHEASLLAKISSVSHSYRELVPVMIYCYGGWLALVGDLSIGRIVAFSAAFAGVYFAIDTMVTYMPVYQNIRDRYEELQRILAVQGIGPVSAHRMGAVDSADPPAAVIQFKDVSFAHSSGARIINNITFTIRPGEHVALVGRSGGGKSTLMNLIAGRLQPSTGSIHYGELEHDQLSNSRRVGLISYVQQVPFVFSGRLRENLLYGISDDPNSNSKYSDTDLLRACSKTGLDADLLMFGLESRLSCSDAADFLANKPRIASGMNLEFDASVSPEVWDEEISIRDNLTPTGCDIDDFNVRRNLNTLISTVLAEAGLSERLKKHGLDFNVGERGSRLSGGQKQKVSITRALLRKRPILLLDEVTASLDEASTLTILQLLKSDLRDVSVIAITHELDSIAEFDRVIALQEGEIYVDIPASAFMNDRALLTSLFDRNTKEPR